MKRLTPLLVSKVSVDKQVSFVILISYLCLQVCISDPTVLVLRKANCHNTKVRDWNKLLPSTLWLKGAFANRKSKDPAAEKTRVPQSFTYVVRSGLVESQIYIYICSFFLLNNFRSYTVFAPADIPGDVQTEERLPVRLRQDGKSRDVFALVKQQMADLHLSQAPLLVFPESCISETDSFINSINDTRHVIQQSLEPERCEELAKLASAFSEDYNHLGRAVTYYGDLTNPHRFRFPYPSLGFISAGPSANQRLCEIELGSRPLPPKPRHLQVVFHRA